MKTEAKFDLKTRTLTLTLVTPTGDNIALDWFGYVADALSHYASYLKTGSDDDKDDADSLKSAVRAITKALDDSRQERDSALNDLFGGD